MPWTAKDANRHTKNPDISDAKWAAIANSILKRTGDEGQAVRVANSKAKKKK
jgi:uncharacterized protein YdaT